MGPDPVATHGSVRDDPRSCSRIPSSIPGTPAVTLLSLQPTLSIGRWRIGQSSTFTARYAEAELIWPLRLADEVPATLRQLLVNFASRVPGAGRTAGATPVTGSFDRLAMRREALGCKGSRGAGNSASTLRQPSRQPSTSLANSPPSLQRPLTVDSTSRVAPLHRC